MNSIIKRRITALIKSQKHKFPILALTGPRQSGKTTLLKEIFEDYEYVSLENPNNRLFATQDPVGFLNQYNEKVILDEVQRVPELFSYLQERVDNSKMMGQYILSGSQNFHLLNSITQSLAGRVALFKLLPLDFSELKEANLLSETYIAAAKKGFYPAIYDRDIDPNIFYKNYVQTYIEKDVTELLNIKDLKLFRTFLNLCAGRAGQLLNFSALANECDISHNTAKAWLSILESSYIIFLLQPYYNNFNKRVVKTPKLYFYDTGLLSYLLGIKTEEDLVENRLKGNIFENMIIAEYQKMNHHLYLDQEHYFWQDSNGNEVDLLMKNNKGFSVFEVKTTQTVTSKLFYKMDLFEKIASPAKVEKTLIYGGEKDENRSNYKVISWKNIFDDKLD
jgi:predicted AAA+ superfamily ATPase